MLKLSCQKIDCLLRVVFSSLKDVAILVLLYLKGTIVERTLRDKSDLVMNLFYTDFFQILDIIVIRVS